MAEKYSVANYSVDQILNFIRSQEIAIPEIQRPYVWSPAQVRDFVDSLHKGYPTGYLIISQNATLRLKDGGISEGKKIMVDGQQRVISLMAAILGQEVIDKNFEKKRIRIAFNPLLLKEEDGEEVFKVLDSAIARDKQWIQDISILFQSDFKRATFVSNYCQKNTEIDQDNLHFILDSLISIKNRQIGVITLSKDLSVSEITEIFIRINSQGKQLNQTDFAMSRIASNNQYGGDILRKTIDYFSRLTAKPETYSLIEKDKEFINSEFGGKLRWLKGRRPEVFSPNYGDILRVSFMHKFYRGKMKDLVSLLSGRDFKARDYKEEIAENSFKELAKGVENFINSYFFNSFVLILKTAGFISDKLMKSKTTLNFAYTLYFILHNDPSINKNDISRLVGKWFVFSTLTNRYISAPESTMESDIRKIREGFLDYFQELEKAELSDTFWEISLVQDLETSSTNNPIFNVFLAAQIKNNDNSLFKHGLCVRDLIGGMGDIHHIFPKSYLQEKGIYDKRKYNQVANYIYLDKGVNIAIGKKSPKEYFQEVFAQCQSKKAKFGNIIELEMLKENMKDNCVPEDIVGMDVIHYDDFLVKRRKLIATKIKEYYLSL